MLWWNTQVPSLENDDIIAGKYSVNPFCSARLSFIVSRRLWNWQWGDIRATPNPGFGNILSARSYSHDGGATETQPGRQSPRFPNYSRGGQWSRYQQTCMLVVICSVLAQMFPVRSAPPGPSSYELFTICYFISMYYYFRLRRCITCSGRVEQSR
ncbi:hypothetical protein F5X99DRAFT_374318 [Biscogniauxia marginata]|nr:hypothetical protein F5X99DRAFT_374318 [Biscogniauxia marginata]